MRVAVLLSALLLVPACGFLPSKHRAWLPRASLSLQARNPHDPEEFTSRRSFFVLPWVLALPALGIKPALAVGGFGGGQPFGPLPTQEPVIDSGLAYVDYEEGTGDAPRPGQVCILNYIGYIQKAPGAELVKFDSSYDRGGPLVYKYGNGRVIRGIEIGVGTMKLGGKRRIYVPKFLGYPTTVVLGPSPLDKIPRDRFRKLLSQMEPEGKIVFDLFLQDVYDDDADPGFYEDETPTAEQTEEIQAKLNALVEAASRPR